MKKFSSILGGKKSSNNGSGSSGNDGGFKFPSSRMFLYALFGFSIVYASQCIYQLDASEAQNQLDSCREDLEKVGKSLDKFRSNIELVMRFK